MALEAAKQMADGSQIVAGYTIRNATFSSPMIITSDPQGTETQLHLRPIRGSSSKDSSSEFMIYVSNGDQWNEACQGIIQIEYEAEGTEVDKGKEARARLHQHRQDLEESIRKCRKTVDERRMYEYLQHIGLDYGDAFQALQQLSYDEDVANGKVGVFHWSAQTHIIHPATLDALFQLVVVALSKGTEKDIPTVMPTRIGKLWITGRGISHPSTNTVKAHARGAFSGRRKATGSMFAMDETTDDVLVLLENTEITTVATREAVTQSQNLKKRLCYRFSWKPDLDLLTHQEVLEYCESTRPNRTTSDVHFYEDLGFLLIKFMSDALDALAEEDLHRTTPHLRRYIEWSRFQVDRFQAGSLPTLSSNHLKWKNLLEDTEYKEHLISQVESTKQGSFFVKIGRQLPQILKGQLDPLTFMFQDDSVPQFYRDINKDVICYEPLNRYLAAISHKNPGLRILEIGAGTGATTDFIFNALSHEGGDARTLACTQYDYTDISPAFFESAAARYEQSHGKMRFRVLDIEADPSKQGFETGTYDLIIAASVSHQFLRLMTH